VSALLAMQTAVIATGCLSVRPSVPFRCFVQTNPQKLPPLVRFSASGRTIILVFGKGKVINYSKTKEMRLGPLSKLTILPLVINYKSVERVCEFKLLG